MQAEDIITVSTQTAAVLAELAVDETAGTDIDTFCSPEDDVPVLQASGFCVETLTLQVLLITRILIIHDCFISLAIFFPFKFSRGCSDMC